MTLHREDRQVVIFIVCGTLFWLGYLFVLFGGLNYQHKQKMFEQIRLQRCKAADGVWVYNPFYPNNHACKLFSKDDDFVAM
jgi:hypothetical protein